MSDIYRISAIIETIPLDQLCAGTIKTTGDTAIDCVLAHMTGQRPRRALVITDGDVGSAPDQLLKQATAACRDIRVLLAPARGLRSKDMPSGSSSCCR